MPPPDAATDTRLDDAGIPGVSSMTTDYTIDTARAEPATAADVGRLCAEVDRILTAAYTRIVADAVATRRTAAIRTTTTGTAATHAFPIRDVRAGAVPTPPRRGVSANQRAPPAQSGTEHPSSTTRLEGGDLTTTDSQTRSSTYPSIEPVPLPHRDAQRRTHTPSLPVPKRRPATRGGRSSVWERTLT
jgi:hypothetical protein